MIHESTYQDVKTGERAGRSPLLFFALLFVITIPFWLFNSLAEQFLPDIPVNLPASALAAFNPLIVALILMYREQGADGVKSLLKRVFDYKRIRNKAWYLPIVLLMPLIMLVEYALLTLLGRPMPDPQLPILAAPVMFAAFFIGAIGEEPGWQGYAYEPLEARWTALGAALILGVVWAVWHTIGFIQTNNPPAWIAWQMANSVALRVLTVWIFNNTGKSVFAAMLLHTLYNVSAFMFPNYGSYYDPFITFLITTGVAIVVVALWGPRTLARYRYA